MKKLLLTIAIVPFILISCNNSSDSNETGSDTLTDAALQNAATTGAEIPVVMPASDANTTVSAPGTSISLPQQKSGPTAAGMNPPHGQPGHRCDIPDGSPLSSPPGTSPSSPIKATAPTQTGMPTISTTPATPITTPITPITTPIKTAPGMNPPHGEPGHDCSIAVGAPLKK